MLKALRLRNFKSFSDQRVEFGPVTLLVGANASGKSNLLEALRFLKGAALGMPLEDVLEDPLRSRQLGKPWPGIRGGAKEVGFRGAPGFELTSEWEIDGERFEYSIACDVRESPRALDERLVRTHPEPQEVMLTAGPAESSGDDLPSDLGVYNVRYGETGRRAGIAGHVLGGPWRAGIGAHLPEEDVHPQNFPAQNAIWRGHRKRLASFQSALRGLAIHEVRPGLMRGYVPTRERELGIHAENLSAVLYRELRGGADPEARESLLDWLRELCGEEVADIDFSETDLDDVMLVLADPHGVRTSARSLSDGTLRFLGLLAALREPGPRTLLLEEPEIGLHPSRLHLLAEQFLSRAAQGRQVIATTHSPGLLAALPADALGDVVVCAITPEGEGTIARRLRELPNFTEVVARRGIEHLFTTRWLERAL